MCVRRCSNLFYITVHSLDSSIFPISKQPPSATVMNPRQRGKAALRAPEGALFDPSVEYSSFQPFEELLEQKRIAREKLLRMAEFIWSDSGLTKCLYDTLMIDLNDIVHLEGIVKCNKGLTWQRKVQLAFLQLRHGGNRRATAVYFEYHDDIPKYESAFKWMSRALGPPSCVSCYAYSVDQLFPNRCSHLQLENLTEDDFFELEAMMHRQTGITGYIASIDCKIVPGNATVELNQKRYNRHVLVFTVTAADGYLLHTETIWRTKTDEAAFRATKLWGIIQRLNFPVFQRLVKGFLVTVPGYMTTDHQMDYQSFLALETDKVISGSIIDQVEGLSPAEKFVNLAIQEGQGIGERVYGTITSMYTTAAQLPAVAGNMTHDFDLHLARLPFQLRNYMQGTMHNLARKRPVRAAKGTLKKKDRMNRSTFDIVVKAYERIATSLNMEIYGGKQLMPRPKLSKLDRYEPVFDLEFFRSLPSMSDWSETRRLEMKHKILGLFLKEAEEAGE